MRHGTASRRQRNRGGSNNNSGRRNNQQRTQVYDSNGPDVRIRGTAYQVAEKYLALAKDSASAGDRIMAENYYQHAEHYIRIINELHGSFDISRLNGAAENEFDDDQPSVPVHQGNSHVPVQNVVQATRKEDDLALPASIIGRAAVIQKQAEAAES